MVSAIPSGGSDGSLTPGLLLLSEYFIPDFSCWKEHDFDRKAFDRLVRDLKSEDAAVA